MTEKAAHRPPAYNDPFTENYTRRFELVTELMASAQARDDDRYARAYDDLVKFEKETGSFDWRVCTGCGGCELDDDFGDRTWHNDELCSVCAGG